MINKEEIKQLPDFLVVGVMKGGTSAAAVNLPFHPDIWMINANTKMEVTTTYRYNLEDTIGGLNGFQQFSGHFFREGSNLSTFVD